MAEIGLAGAAGLAFVGPGRIDVGLLELVDLLLAVGGRDLVEDVVKADHGLAVSPCPGSSRRPGGWSRPRRPARAPVFRVPPDTPGPGHSGRATGRPGC